MVRLAQAYLRTMGRTEKGTFTTKYADSPKTFTGFRLTEQALNFLEFMAENYDCSKTDVIEKWVRGEFRNTDALIKLDEFIYHQRSRYGKNNAQKGEFSTDGSRWYYLNEFRRWVEGNER